MNRAKILQILAGYMPPLTPSQANAIADSIMAEWEKFAKQLEAKLKPKPSRSSKRKTSARG